MSDMQRTDSTQAMKSILSAYGDDEAVDELQSNVDDISGSEDEGGGHKEHLPAAITDLEALQKEEKRLAEVETSSKEGTPKKAKRERRANMPQLVSYGAGDMEGEADDHDMTSDEEEEEEPEEEEAPLDDEASPALMPFLGHDDGDLEDDVQLPPEPLGKCSNKLQDKIKGLYEKMRRDGLDMNTTIQRRKDFRNPSIYEKLIEFCDIDEKGTNYPPELYNPSFWGKDSMYDELAKAQKVEMDRREREKKERTKIEFVTVTKKQSAEAAAGEQRRKSKWDAQPPAAAGKPTVVMTTSLNPPTVAVSTATSAAKATVISAVGTIKKHK